MVKPIRRSLLLVVIAGTVACGSSSSISSPEAGAQGGDIPDSGAPIDSGASVVGPFDGSAACSNDVAVEGCACEALDRRAPCWTGPAADRHRGDCRDGTATCVQRGEFLVWGACAGEVTVCTTMDSGSPADADAEAEAEADAPPADCYYAGIGTWASGTTVTRNCDTLPNALQGTYGLAYYTCTNGTVSYRDHCCWPVDGQPDHCN